MENIIDLEKYKLIQIHEHCNFSQETIDLLADENIIFNQTPMLDAPVHLGISNTKSSYYIGADWLKENKIAINVLPKMEIDYISLFVAALNFSPSAEYFSKCYGINFNVPQIKSDTVLDQITPLIIFNYLFSIEKLIKKGLKKGYLNKEENLTLKIKGKIQLQKNLSKNIFPKREDRIYCNYHEFSENIPENILLKKALIISKQIISNIAACKKHKDFPIVCSKINKCLNAFRNVNENININIGQNFNTNKLFKEYTESIKIAKLILRRNDDSLDEKKHFTTVPAHWIDMSRLYEVYVYSLLDRAYPGKILFQVTGYGGWGKYTAVDFIKKDINETLILDAKYKPQYKDSNDGILSDIREISGYARDEIILNKMGISKDDVKIPKCIIIYPEIQNLNFNNEPDSCAVISDINQFDGSKKILDLCNNNPIPSFREFYKLCIPLPTKKAK